jgi:hypothetical protein
MNTFIFSILASLLAAVLWDCFKFFYIKIKDRSNGRKSDL